MGSKRGARESTSGLVLVVGAVESVGGHKIAREAVKMVFSVCVVNALQGKSMVLGWRSGWSGPTRVSVVHCCRQECSHQ